MSILYMFPGQGAQRAGMLHALPDHTETIRTLREARDVLHEDALLLDNAEALASTRAVQLCLLIAGVAQSRVLAAHDVQPSLVAGLSIGAFPAAVVAGALPYEDALRLVSLRGQAMQSAYPSGYGMAAISGVNQAQVEEIIANVHQAGTPVYLANLNSPSQFVIAGHNSALRTALAQAHEQGAQHAQVLNVSVPSHCELLDPVAESLRNAMAGMTLQPTRCRYLSASRVRVLYQPDDIADDLATNVARPTHWHETARLAWEYGARLAVEMPGGSALSRLTVSVLEHGHVVCSDNTPVQTIVTLAQRMSD